MASERIGVENAWAASMGKSDITAPFATPAHMEDSRSTAEFVMVASMVAEKTNVEPAWKKRTPFGSR